MESQNQIIKLAFSATVILLVNFVTLYLLNKIIYKQTFNLEKFVIIVAVELFVALILACIIVLTT